nr:class I histocompatibility antigen - African clawed frog [Xenopus laevis]
MNYMFWLFSLSVCDVPCDSHTIQYYTTLIPSPTPGVNHYTNSAFLDGFRYGKFDSDTCHVQFFDPALNALTEHVEKKTKYVRVLVVFQKTQMEFLMGYLNKTYDSGDFYVYQRKFVCELNEDGTHAAYEEIAFDGKEIMVFDKENEFRPNVKVSSSESESGTKLYCWVYGFYPRDVEVKWIKNGRDEIYSEESAEILPNPDGTYQIRVSVEVTPEEGATYSCHVDHSSLEKTLVVPFESTDLSTYYIVIPVVAALSLLLVALGIFVCRKRRRKGSSGLCMRNSNNDSSVQSVSR